MDADQAGGMLPEYVADRIMESIAFEEKEVIVDVVLHRFAIALRTLCPNLFFWLMARRARITK
jgi:dehydrogenase/reductase SDR family protein 7B